MADEPSKIHAKLSASGAHRWMTCPASVKLIEQAPVPPESSYAIEGTSAHWVLEQLLNSRFPFTRARDLRKQFDPSMVDHAEAACGYINDLVTKEANLFIESPIMISHLHPDLGGTVDAVIVDEFLRLTVIDYKYGKTPVSPEENHQLMIYALGFLETYFYNFIEVSLVIIQPRGTGSPHVKEWLTDIPRMKKFKEELIDAAQATQYSDLYRAGRHCYFCAAKDICPETAKANLKKAKQIFASSEKTTKGKTNGKTTN